MPQASWWWYLLGILFGIIILAAIVVLLYKVNTLAKILGSKTLTIFSFLDWLLQAQQGRAVLSSRNGRTVNMNKSLLFSTNAQSTNFPFLSPFKPFDPIHPSSTHILKRPFVMKTSFKLFISQNHQKPSTDKWQWVVQCKRPMPACSSHSSHPISATWNIPWLYLIFWFFLSIVISLFISPLLLLQLLFYPLLFFTPVNTLSLFFSFFSPSLPVDVVVF